MVVLCSEIEQSQATVRVIASPSAVVCTFAWTRGWYISQTIPNGNCDVGEERLTP